MTSTSALRSRGPRPGRLLGWLAGVSTLVLACRGAWQLWPVATSSERLPLWDEAKYGVAGQRLAAAAAELDLLGLLEGVYRLSVWPPTYPLLEAPVFLVWGLDYGVARGLQVILWAAAVLATWWAARRLLERPWGDVAGLLASSAVAASPFFAAFATLNMLEVPGLLLLAVALGCYLRALDAEEEGAEQGAGWWRATWLVSLALFLCKYNYGLLWLGPLALAEARRRAGSWRAAAGRGLSVLAAAEWRRPFGFFVLALLGVMLAVRLTGGFELEVAGGKVSVTSMGGPAQLLFVAVLLRLLLPWRRAVRGWRRISRLAPRDREMVRCWLMPVALWMLPPPHLKDFFGFVENRAAGPPAGSLEWLLFYPRLVPELFGAASIGILVAGLAVLGVVLRALLGAGHGGDSERVRIIVLGLGCSLAALLLHPYKLPRFAFSAAWWLILAAALGALAAARLLAAWSPSAKRWSFAVAVTVAGAAALVAGVAGVDLERVAGEHRVRTAHAEVASVLDVLTAPPATGECDRVVLGTWNALSPHLLEWHARRRAASAPACRLSSDFELAGRSVGRLLSHLRSRRAEVVLVEKLGDGPEVAVFAAETAWLEDAREWLRSSGRLLEERRVAGYSLSFFAVSGPAPEAPRKPLASSSAKAAS